LICATFGYTRQGYYKHMKQTSIRERRKTKIIDFVNLSRRRQCRVGTRKLQRMMQNTNDPELVISRDKLFELLREEGLLVNARRRFTHTTDYRHNYTIYENQLNQFVPTAINQAWVVDITYLATCNGFLYLYLLTDLHSRKIISYAVSDNLRAETACSVLTNALNTVKDASNIIHHSDHGSQYCSKSYQDILDKHQIKCSMTGRNRCYDNAVAERVNGILKTELGLSKVFRSIEIAKEAVNEAIRIYNHERLHTSLGYNTPDAVHRSAA
jgi:putative transposase